MESQQFPRPAGSRAGEAADGDTRAGPWLPKLGESQVISPLPGSRSGVTDWRPGGSVLIMAPSRESLWLWAGASFVAVGAALGGVSGAVAVARPGYWLWSSAPMAGAYVACALALACLWAAIRDWRFPFAADRSGHVPSALAWRGPPAAGWVDRAELEVVVSALTGAGGGAVALTTGLVGAGGFGKTMLAKRACQHPAVLHPAGRSHATPLPSACTTRGRFRRCQRRPLPSNGEPRAIRGPSPTARRARAAHARQD